MDKGEVSTRELVTLESVDMIRRNRRERGMWKLLICLDVCFIIRTVLPEAFCGMSSSVTFPHRGKGVLDAVKGSQRRPYPMGTSRRIGTSTCMNGHDGAFPWLQRGKLKLL